MRSCSELMVGLALAPIAPKIRTNRTAFSLLSLFLGDLRLLDPSSREKP
jgi:hypothetical protein